MRIPTLTRELILCMAENSRVLYKLEGKQRKEDSPGAAPHCEHLHWAKDSWPCPALREHWAQSYTAEQPA